MVGADTVPEVDVLRAVLFSELEGTNEAAEDGTKDFLPGTWLRSKGREFVGSPLISLTSNNSYSLPNAKKWAKSELKCGSERRWRICG